MTGMFASLQEGKNLYFCVGTMASTITLKLCILLVAVAAELVLPLDASPSRKKRSPLSFRPMQATERVQNDDPTIVGAVALCPLAQSIRACLGNCSENSNCRPPNRCCRDRCGTFTCVAVIEEVRPSTCEEADCQRQQGSVCVTENGRAFCKCTAFCPLPKNNTSHLCGPNNLSYLSRCHMDKAACEMEITIPEVACSIVLPRGSTLPTPSLSQAPEPIYLPTPHLARAGDNVSLRYVVAGSPEPNACWRRHDSPSCLTPGSTNGRISVSTSDKSLHIREVRLSDSGEYSCLAENSIGSVEVTYTLIVRSAGPMIPRNMGVISFREKCLANAKSQSRHCGENTRDRPLRKYWQFDRKTEKCVANRFRDCSAILNKHLTKADCERECQNSCYLPPVQGPCKNFRQRVFYNHVTGNCEPFRYGGCNGNSNNFLTTEQCRQTCPHPTGPPFPARTCPLCSKHLATAFCSESFVVAGYVKGISPGRAPSPSRGRTITLHITRVFSDREDLGLVHLLAAAYYRRPVKRFKLATTPHCPCPDFKTLVHQEEIAQTGVSRRCGQSAGARSNGRISSRCTELLISGRVVDGVPTIGQGSLAVTATSVNLARMMTNRNHPNFCRIIKAAERQQQVLDRASRMLGYK